MTGKYFEEFNIGDRDITASRTVTEADIVAFAGLSGDYNPLHTDEELMKNMPFGGRIAHGMLILSIATGLDFRLGLIEGTAIAFLGMNNVRFTNAVLPGDTIHVEEELIRKRETKDPTRGIITAKFTVKNQRDESVAEAEITLMVSRK